MFEQPCLRELFSISIFIPEIQCSPINKRMLHTYVFLPLPSFPLGATIAIPTPTELVPFTHCPEPSERGNPGWEPYLLMTVPKLERGSRNIRESGLRRILQVVPAAAVNSDTRRRWMPRFPARSRRRRRRRRMPHFPARSSRHLLLLQHRI